MTPLGLDQQFRNVLGNTQHAGLEVSSAEDGTQVQDLLSNSLNNVNITTAGADILSSSVLNSTTADTNPRNDYVTFDAYQHISSAGQRNSLPQWALRAQNNGIAGRQQTQAPPLWTHLQQDHNTGGLQPQTTSTPIWLRNVHQGNNPGGLEVGSTSTPTWPRNPHQGNSSGGCKQI